MDRLDFELPGFVRVSWASERARQVWDRRLRHIADAWQAMQWIACVETILPCAILTRSIASGLRTGETWKAHGLSHISLDDGFSSSSSIFLPRLLGPKAEGDYIAIGTPSNLMKLRDAWRAGDPGAIGAALGYPHCCRHFNDRVCRHDGYLDTTWWMSIATESVALTARSAEIKGVHLSNLMWHCLDVRATPHRPCRFDCPETLALGEQILASGRRMGYADEVEWLEEVLSWPVEWSAMHGIAEIKTPILRLISNTDATSSKYTVRVHGTSYPDEGAHGGTFPYNRWSRKLAVHTL